MENTKLIVKVRKTATIRKTIQSSTATDPGYHIRKQQNTINITNKSQEVSPFPAGDHKAAMNRRQSMKNTRHNLNTNDPHKKMEDDCACNPEDPLEMPH